MAASKPEAIAQRESFLKALPTMEPEKLVFLDEVGVDTALSRSHGWAPRGEVPVIERPAHGKRASFIGAIAMDGVRALRPVEGYVNGDEFVAFLREDLGPNLRPGDVVVMDGPSIHKVAGVAQALAERGATAYYLPPYCPEFNPIEMTWAWLKKRLRDAPRRQLAALRERVDQLWGILSAHLCARWIGHCGYRGAT